MSLHHFVVFFAKKHTDPPHNNFLPDRSLAVFCSEKGADTLPIIIFFLIAHLRSFVVSKEQTVKLLQFSQLTVQCMKHIKSKALQKQAEAEKQADLYHRECQRLQEELKKRMIENCRLIAGGPMGGSSAAPADPDAASQQVQQDECPDDEPTGAPPHTEDDRMMLADLVSELKRNKLVDGKQAGQLDKEMASLKIGEQNTLWDVLARYEDSGDIRLVLKDLSTRVFAASGGEAA